MIEKHVLKIINNEQILFIHLNFNYEFGSFKKIKKLPIIKSIQKYCKKNKIPFQGTKIVLVTLGITFGTLIVNKEFLNITKNTYNYVDKIIFNRPIKVERYDNSNIKAEIIIEPAKEIEETPKITIEVPKEIQTPKYEPPEVAPIPKEEKITENKTYLTLYRNNGEILNLELEEYIIGVVAAEMPASFHIEALKSQSIIARTYTLRLINRNTKITESLQAYNSIEELKSRWGNNFDKYYNKIKDAVDSTKGIYMTYGNEIIDAVYYSTSNGYTEDSIYVWGYNIPYLKSVESPYDINASTYLRETFITYETLTSKLGYQIDENTEITILSRTPSNRINELKINDNIYKGIDIKNLLTLRSTDFDIKKDASGITFTTRGYGHGVGLSQYGANGYANNGYNKEQILNHYYQGITIRTS